MKKTGYINIFFMVAISAITQILTLMKTTVVAGIFGATSTMDAYTLAYNISSFVFGFVAAGISTIVIPEYVNKKNRKDIDGFITLLYSLIALLLIVISAFRYHIIGTFNNRSEIFVELTSNILIILLFAQFLSSVANVTVAYFQCEGKYNTPKIIHLISQIIVVAILLLKNDISIMHYALIISGGFLINFVFDTGMALKSGWRYMPNFHVSQNGKILFKRFLPIVFSTGVYRISLMADSVIAACLETGKITILGYCSQISAMVNSLIIANLLIYIYPKITKSININGAQEIFWKQTALFHAIVCLVIAGFISVGEEAVRILFCRGLFSAQDGYIVYIGAALYILGQQTSVIRDLIYRYFYAKGETKMPTKNSVVVSVLNIGLSLILVNIIGFYGIIIGTLMSSFISLILIFVQFSKHIGFTEKLKCIILRYAINILIMLSVVSIVLITKSLFVIDNEIVAIVVYGIETFVLYTILQLLFNRKNIWVEI